MSRFPVSECRPMKSLSTVFSSASPDMSSRERPRMLALRIRSGVWVAAKTACEGTTASVLTAPPALAGSQHRYPRKSGITALHDLDRTAGTQELAPRVLDVQVLASIGIALEPERPLVLAAQQGEGQGRPCDGVSGGFKAHGGRVQGTREHRQCTAESVENLDCANGLARPPG